MRPALPGLAFTALLAAAPLAGDDASILPTATPLPGIEWGAEAGYGVMAHWNHGNAEERLLLLEPSAGFPLSRFLEYTVEGHFAQYLAPEGYMVGLMPVGGRLTIGNWTTRPYFSLGAGFGWTDLLELQEIDRRFNFLLQASLGVRRAVSPTQAWTLEIRLSHVSNAGTTSSNLGLNTVVIMTGWRFR